MAENEYDLGSALAEALEEVRAWQKGRVALEVVNINPLPAARIKEIRKKVAKSTRGFEQRFGIPIATMNNWEQGRREPDIAARLLLRVIEVAPEVVERMAHSL